MTLLQVHIDEDLMKQFRKKHKGHMAKLIEKWIREDLDQKSLLDRLKDGEPVEISEIIEFIEGN